MPIRSLAPVRVNPVLLHPQEQRVRLDDRWSFRLDPEDRGVRERWFEELALLGEPIQVPGCWQGQGFGSDGEEIVRDFRLRARTFRATYTGTGWYGRACAGPEERPGRRWWLNFGGAHPSAEVWLNGVRLGENSLPFAPFGFEVTDVIRFGAENRLAVRVHEQNRELGLAFNWQGNWSGLYRGVELTATGEQFIESFAAYPDVDGEVVRFRARIGGGQRGPATLRLSVGAITRSRPPADGAAEASRSGDRSYREVAAEAAPTTEGEIVCELAVPSPQLWSPDAPNLYRVDAALTRGDEVLDALSERIGFVRLSTEGKHFLINGEPYYLRGSGDFVSCPETGCPDTDRDRWRRKLATLRDYGYNYVRCQSYVYAPEYFDAADEVGLLVQSEMGMLGGWGGMNEWHRYAWPEPTPGYRETLRRQWNLVVQRDVNHPSANLYCMSNELGAQTYFPRTAWQCYRETKAIKPTALVIWTDGGWNPDLPGDFVNDHAGRDADCPLDRKSVV